MQKKKRKPVCNLDSNCKSYNLRSFIIWTLFSVIGLWPQWRVLIELWGHSRWSCKGSAHRVTTGRRHVAHPRVCRLTPRHLLCHTEQIVPHSSHLPFRIPSREDAPLGGQLMLNDRQTLIKAAAGNPPVTVQRVQRGDDRWWDKSSMPALERGQISRIRQLGWTLLAPSQTIQRTSAIARLSHFSLWLWPFATAQLSSGAVREELAG